VRSGREEDPHVLVVCLVGAIAGAKTEIVGDADDVNELG
jgi:hypothetical protein